VFEVFITTACHYSLTAKNPPIRLHNFCIFVWRLSSSSVLGRTPTGCRHLNSITVLSPAGNLLWRRTVVYDHTVTIDKLTWRDDAMTFLNWDGDTECWYFKKVRTLWCMLLYVLRILIHLRKNISTSIRSPSLIGVHKREKLVSHH